MSYIGGAWNHLHCQHHPAEHNQEALCAYRVPVGSVDCILSYCHHNLSDKTLLDLMPYLKEKKVAVISASFSSMGLLRKEVSNSFPGPVFSASFLPPGPAWAAAQESGCRALATSSSLNQLYIATAVPLAVRKSLNATDPACLILFQYMGQSTADGCRDPRPGIQLPRRCRKLQRRQLTTAHSVAQIWQNWQSRNL